MPGSSHGYLLRLTRPIEGLMAAENIDIMDADHDGFICPASADGIVVTECDWASAGFASIEPFILPPPTNEL